MKIRWMMHEINKYWGSVFFSMLFVFTIVSVAWSNPVRIRLDSFKKIAPGQKQYDYSVDLGLLDIVTVEVADRIILSDMAGVTGQNVLAPATQDDEGRWQNNGITNTTAQWIAGVENTNFFDWGTYRVIANTDPSKAQWTITPFDGGILSGTVSGPDRQQVPPPDPIANSTTGAPRAGSNSSQMSFFPKTGVLTFTDSIINFANLFGNESTDDFFLSDPTDPILGARLSVSSFMLDGPIGSGFLFTGGTMEITTNDDRTLFAADIPFLLIDDNGLDPFGVNIFGVLDISLIDTTFEDPLDNLDFTFLESYIDFWASNGPKFPPELFGRTSIPVTSLIRNDQFFTTTIEGFGTGFSTPEPGTMILLGSGLVGLAGFRKKFKK